MASDSANLPGGKITFLLFLALVNFSFTIGIHNDNFSEELYVKPFSSGHVMFHFQFTTVWNVSIDKPESCKHTLYTVLFPMGLISYLCGISNEPLSWYTTSTFSMTSPFFPSQENGLYTPCTHSTVPIDLIPVNQSLICIGSCTNCSIGYIIWIYDCVATVWMWAQLNL